MKALATVGVAQFLRRGTHFAEERPQGRDIRSYKADLGFHHVPDCWVSIGEWEIFNVEADGVDDAGNACETNT